MTRETLRGVHVAEGAGDDVVDEGHATGVGLGGVGALLAGHAGNVVVCTSLGRSGGASLQLSDAGLKVSARLDGGDTGLKLGGTLLGSRLDRVDVMV